MKQRTVHHLNTEELLLLADGELSMGRVGHFDNCVECQERLGAVLGELTTISSALTASHIGGADSAESWARLEQAISHTALSQDAHLSPEELLLLIDGALAPARAEHAKRCFGCGSAKDQVQQLLLDVESDLRALAPSEPVERRLAAEQALKQHLEAAEEQAAEKKVVVFPTRRTTRYAAAAGFLLSAMAGGWIWMQAPVAQLPTSIATAPTVETLVLAASTPEIVAPQLTVPEREQTVVTPATELLRFETAAWRPGVAPEVAALLAAAPPIRFAVRETPQLSFSALPAVSPPASAEDVAAEVLSAKAYLAVLEARQWQRKADLWREDVQPTWRDGRLVFAGSVESESARRVYIAALEKQAAGRPVEFDLTIRAEPAVAAEGSTRDASIAVGGLVRTALLEHYRDAARRSFQSTETSGLDAEIARYVSEVFSNQNDLVGHAYQLDQLLNHSSRTGETDTAEVRQLTANLVRFHVNGAERGEATIYGHLSEALPRRYWRYQGEDQALESSDDIGQESQALLRDVLGLERTLTTVLTGSRRTVAFDAAGTSSGELLRRIHDRLNRIKDLTRATL